MAKCGFAFSRKSPSPRNRWKREWAKAKARSNPGSPSSSLPMSCSKSTALPRQSLASHCAWRRPSCRLKRSLFHGTEQRGKLLIFMKKNQRKEIQEKTLPELMADGRNMRQEIFNLRLQQASAQLEKSARLHTLRRDIARIETRMSQLRKKAA